MMQSARMPDLLPILPEVVLAIGAMLLLLAGTLGAAMRGARSLSPLSYCWWQPGLSSSGSREISS